MVVTPPLEQQTGKPDDNANICQNESIQTDYRIKMPTSRLARPRATMTTRRNFLIAAAVAGFSPIAFSGLPRTAAVAAGKMSLWQEVLGTVFLLCHHRSSSR